MAYRNEADTTVIPGQVEQPPGIKRFTRRPSRNKPLAIGFIGGSLDSAVGYTHHVSCSMDNYWRVAAGCFSTNGATNRETAQTYGVASDRVYDDWRAMLRAEKGRVGAIVVLTPTPSHHEIVLACLEAGIPTICEKALTANSRTAEEILRARDRNNGFLAVIYNYTGYPMIRELRNTIRTGKLGKILHFQAEMPQEGFLRVDANGTPPMPQAWRLTDGPVPTIHLDLAVHLHQMIDYLLGEKPIEVISDQAGFGHFAGIVDNVTCLCKYTHGVQGQMWFSKTAVGHRNGLRIRIYGSHASAEWYQACPEETILAYADGRREIVDRVSSCEVTHLRRYNRFKAGHPAGFVEAFANLYRDIADCVDQFSRTGEWQSEEVFGAELAIEGLQFVEAMQASVETKTWQQIARTTGR